MKLFDKLFKKPSPEMTFINIIPGYAEAYPIIEASKYKREWVDKNIKDLQAFRQEFVAKCPLNMFKTGGLGKGFISKCPGIRDFINTGYIVTTPCDFLIETNGDGETFNTADMSPSQFNYFHVSRHSKEQLHNYSPLPQNTLKTIIKISTGWFVVPDERYVFLVAPVLYGNENRFTTACGVWDPLIDCQINPFLFWHVLKGREVVKAGTPLVQYIPIPREFVQPELISRTATDNEIKKIKAMQVTLVSASGVTYRDRRKEVVKKIFSKTPF